MADGVCSGCVPLGGWATYGWPESCFSHCDEMRLPPTHDTVVCQDKSEMPRGLCLFKMRTISVLKPKSTRTSQMDGWLPRSGCCYGTSGTVLCSASTGTAYIRVTGVHVMGVYSLILRHRCTPLKCAIFVQRCLSSWSAETFARVSCPIRLCGVFVQYLIETVFFVDCVSAMYVTLLSSTCSFCQTCCSCSTLCAVFPRCLPF